MGVGAEIYLQAIDWKRSIEKWGRARVSAINEEDRWLGRENNVYKSWVH